MLYQLSYASIAQTEEIYHTGNQIASKFLPAANPLPLQQLQYAQNGIGCPIE
jgi:hypothetical protein